MNLFETPDESRGHLARKIGLSDDQIERLWENYRPLGACSGYVLEDLRHHTHRRDLEADTEQPGQQRGRTQDPQDGGEHREELVCYRADDWSRQVWSSFS